ncbi:MAG: hypothetical protein HY936_10965 [Nitrosomonadales bacterium]|nr:hypothetical protein [Nitrosomonadales bacterium]
MTTSIPQTHHNHARVIERADGFYWQDKVTDELCGPFPTLIEAMQDMQDQSDTDYGEGESLAEAETDIGISNWVDPETGEASEDLQLHLSDE